MKYFFVSDIHGCYDKLITALTNNNFDSEKDTLVILNLHPYYFSSPVFIL